MQLDKFFFHVLLAHFPVFVLLYAYSTLVSVQWRCGKCGKCATVYRNMGAGLGSFAGRFGGILYPYINYLSKADVGLGRQLPLVIFGVLSIVGGFLALPLPETRHRPLPKTIDDVEHYDEFCRRRRLSRASQRDTPVTAGACLDERLADTPNNVVENVELK